MESTEYTPANKGKRFPAEVLTHDEVRTSDAGDTTSWMISHRLGCAAKDDRNVNSCRATLSWGQLARL